MTAWKALKPGGRVSEAVRMRVIDSQRRLNYVPNAHSRALFSGSSSTIGMVVPTLTHTFFGRVIAGAQKEARKRGLTLLYQTSEMSEESEREIAHKFLSLRVEGLVITPNPTRASVRFWQEIAAQVPVVFLDAGVNKSHYVTVDHRQGFRALTEHLLKQGRTPVFMPSSWPLIHATVRAQRLGYLDAMRSAQAEPGTLAVPAQAGLHGEEYGYASMANCLRTGVLPDALLCPNDANAVGAMLALHEKGIVVGRDILLTGYDDAPFAAYLNPPLTTVRQPAEQLGIEVIESICALGKSSAGGKKPSQRSVLPELIVRRSTSP